MAGRPYTLVSEVVGSHRDLVRRGITSEEELGMPFDARAWAALLTYVRQDSASA